MIISNLLDKMNFWERELEKTKEERNKTKEYYLPEAWIRSTAYFGYRKKIKKIKQELAKINKEIFFS